MLVTKGFEQCDLFTNHYEADPQHSNSSSPRSRWIINYSWLTGAESVLKEGGSVVTIGEKGFRERPQMS